jgi:predicted component of type VI protein secretion system
MIEETMSRTVLLFALLAIFSSACSTSTPEPTSAPERSAWYACTIFVQQEKKISYLDAEDYNPNGVTKLENDRYQVEVFYVGRGKFFRCELLRKSDGNWQLEGLEVR